MSHTFTILAVDLSDKKDQDFYVVFAYFEGYYIPLNLSARYEAVLRWSLAPDRPGILVEGSALDCNYNSTCVLTLLYSTAFVAFFLY